MTECPLGLKGVCPWGPSEWERLGRIELLLSQVVTQQVTLSEQVLELRFVKRRSIQWGSLAGAIAFAVSEAIRRLWKP